MSYKSMPYIVVTEPANMSVDVPTSTDITIVFSTDMDPASLPLGITVQEAQGGAKVNGSITYKDRTAVFKPRDGFAPGTTYLCIISGDVNLEDGRQVGVRSILGYPMAGVFTVSFTTATGTELKAPGLIYPADLSVIPVGSVEFKWTPVDGASAYELEISQAPEMDPLFYSTTTSGTSVQPDTAFIPGNYFWRVRALNEEGRPGLWSAAASFTLAEDTADPHETYDDVNVNIDTQTSAISEPVLNQPDITGMVDPELDSIVLTLPFVVNPEDISVRLVGKSLSGNPVEDHGLVKITFTTDNPDASTTVITIRGEQV